tara:strand:+ start:1514 stop:2299 length:786 start_codon:yes stop_codon:yes gene_type:complete
MSKASEVFYKLAVSKAPAKNLAKKAPAKAPAKNVAEKKKPVKKQPTLTRKDLMKKDVQAKTLKLDELIKKYPTVSKADILTQKVDTAGQTADYKKYLSAVQPHIGSKRTDVDSMFVVYDALRESGLDDDVIDGLKDDWFGDESNIDWTKGGDGVREAMDQLRDVMEEKGVEQGRDMQTNEEGGIYSTNLPFSTSAPEGLAQEAQKIKERRESMQQPDKDIANRYINKSQGEKADVFDSHPDQAMYERGIESLRSKMTDLGL